MKSPALPLLFALGAMTAAARFLPASAPAPHSQAAIGAYGRLPLAFEENHGQAPEAYRFVARGAGYTLGIRDDGAVLSLAGRARERTGGHRGPVRQGAVRMRLAGTSVRPRLAGAGRLEGRVSYLTGRSRAAWRTNIGTFERVKAEGVYPGIDLVYYGNQRQLEYDFVVSPGADPGRIALQYEGADQLRLAPDGSLRLTLDGGELRQHRPVAYQLFGGKRVLVQAEYVLNGGVQAFRRSGVQDALGSTSNSCRAGVGTHPYREALVSGDERRTPERLNAVRFRLGTYDPTRPLIIDPLLSYSTYLGGTGNDAALAVAVEQFGGAFVVGSTASLDFPVAGALQQENAGGTFSGDAFVAKLSPSGASLMYATYIGGAGDDMATSVAVDSSGSAYVAGVTDSADFPVRGALQTQKKGSEDGFLLKLGPSGSSLVASTYFGGSAVDQIHGVTVDSSRNIYVAGRTLSDDLPVTNAQQAARAGLSDGFLARLNASASAVLYCTYLGGSLDDSILGLAVGEDGDAYVTGETYSDHFPVSHPVQGALAGGADAFVARYSAAGAVLFSSYLGGRGFDQALDIAIDPAGSAYITGETSSSDFPVSNALQPEPAGGDDAFLTKIDASGSRLAYSTYLGGLALDGGYAVAVDPSGSAFVAGYTESPDFPVQDATQAAPGGGGDAFLTRVDPSGAVLVYSTYLGGSGSDQAFGLALDPQGNAYVAGQVSSTDFPLVTPAQGTFGGNLDGFVARFTGAPAGPGIPSNLTAQAVSDIEIRLAWQDNSVEEVAFAVERKSGAAAFAEIARADADATQYRDRGLSPQTTYSYRVRAIGAQTSSGYSNERSAMTQPAAGGRMKVAARLNFGRVRTGITVEKTLAIRNLSRSELLRVTLGTPVPPFVLSAPETTIYTIPIGGKLDVKLKFTPAQRGRASGTILVESSDSRKGAVRVKLLGVGR